MYQKIMNLCSFSYAFFFFQSLLFPILIFLSRPFCLRPLVFVSPNIFSSLLSPSLFCHTPSTILSKISFWTFLSL
ncbi:hypothetical protein CAEBREN_32538 [Caenorhabditis brenneri]|uniref:Uncharacterized protein n=1 Tax=Caenorhabditis brenneri TaxID=135651 RepID=G0MHM8_CAEBE|nr:hypothetical protein CAEBREN_32538 [Caenorhabditis brenneri]